MYAGWPQYAFANGPELAGLDKGFQFVLYFFEGGFLGLGLQGRDYINIVKSVQVIEPQDMGMYELCAFYDISYDAAVVRRFNLEGVIHAHGRRMAMRRGTDSANPLRYVPGVAGVPSLQDDLETPEQRTGCPCILHLAAFDLDIDPQMSFDPCHRVYGYPGHYFLPPSFSLVLPEVPVAAA